MHRESLFHFRLPKLLRLGNREIKSSIKTGLSTVARTSTGSAACSAALLRRYFLASEQYFSLIIFWHKH